MFSTPKPSDSTVTPSFFVLFTLPFRFIKDTFLTTALPPPKLTVSVPSVEESTPTSPSSTACSLQSSHYIFDLYIASGEYDECWLNTFALPTLEHSNLTYTKTTILS